MKSEFLTHKGTQQLSVFFSGWGCDGAVCQSRKSTDDLLVLSDYRDLENFDNSYFKYYDSVKVTAWSLGVWVACRCLNGSDMGNIVSATAINGTMRPIDADRGIDPVIFDGTLQGLNERNLMKFRRRMCGNEYANFMDLNPSADVERLKAELQHLSDCIRNDSDEIKNIWTKAIVGASDLIFTPEAQIRSWNEIGLEPEVVECSHYSKNLFFDI